MTHAALEAAGWTPDRFSNFSKLVGPIWTIHDGEKHRFGFIVDDKHDNSQGRAHGGMIMTFCDHGMGMTAQLSRPDRTMFTVSFECQFIGGADTGAFVELDSQIIQATKSLMFMRGTCFTGDKILATCSGVWKLVGKQ